VLRSLVVALDDTEPSRAAQEVAVRLAQVYRADITGLAVLDRGHIAGPTAVGIGGMAYKQHRDQVKLEQAHRFLERLEHQFEESCENLGIAWRIIEAEGAPFELICGEAHRHDLVVIGRDTDFHIDEEPEVADVVHRLLEENPRPVLVCPEKAALKGPIVVASDGGPRASRAIHMLALLGLAKDRPVHVLATAGGVHGETESALNAERPAELLRRHGLEVEMHPIHSSTPPEDLVCEYVNRLGATMIVIGSSGHSRIRDLLLGSTARSLLNSCPVPLFVSH
jgi:nucleotide-binding universal stress UspA family protein